MSPATSSPSPDALLTAPAPTKPAFKDSPWRPVLTCGGALGLGLLLVPMMARPTAAPVGTAASHPEIFLPSASVMTLRPAKPPGAMLRGRLQLVADVAGKAPVSGAVARQLVNTGAQVKRGDAILEISSGEAVRPAPRVESQQNAAERSQIAAVDAQTALAQKVAIAQARLRAAGERVTRAQEQVVAARDVVRRLQNGEAVPASRIPASFRIAARPTKRRAAKPRAVNRAGEIAQQQARAAQDAAREGALDVQAARQMLADVQANGRGADERLKNATQNVAEVEARFDDKKASGADVEAARASQKEAQNAVNSAAKSLANAQAEIERREKSAQSLQKYAETARLAAKDFPATPEVPAPDEKTRSNGEPAAGAGEDGRVTLDQAVKFAQAALDESRRASRQAEALHGEVDDYQRQIKSSNSRIADASQNLAASQEKVLEVVPKAKFTTAFAPSDGVVMWVSRLAREVGRGQSVFGLARGDKMNAHFEDSSGLWRSLKTGAVLPAAVVAAGGEPNPAAPTLAVKLTQIEVPAAQGGAARLSGEIQAAPQTAPPLLRAGDVVMASVPQPGRKSTLSVPPSALLKRGAASYVAVLVSDGRPSKGETERFRLKWQMVRTGRGDVMSQEIVSGLSAGARVVAETTQLEELGLTPAASASDGAANPAPRAEGDNLTNQVRIGLTAPAV